MNPLAIQADLSDRRITVPGGVDVQVLLRSASSAIRDAAGSSISRSTTTVKLPGSSEQWLAVPLQPANAVTDVEIDGTAVTDFTFMGDRLWRASGWRNGYAPVLVELTVDHGYDAVPDDIVDLCCSLVAASIAAMEDGYDPKRGLANVRIDDYSEGYFKGEDEVVNPLDLPERTRAWLRSRFGSQAHVIGTY